MLDRRLEALLTVQETCQHNASEVVLGVGLRGVWRRGGERRERRTPPK
jgi:hypothetical protein